MPMLLNDLALGRYHPGDSPLHRLDPRLKLVGLPLLATLAFAGAGFDRLGVLALLLASLLLLGRIPLRLCWRSVYALRWLILFTMALHLLFSPGRTLFGQTWLSLDGLLQGALIDCRLVLAVGFSTLLTLSTAPTEIAAALNALLFPLRRWLPVRETVLLFLLVLQFIQHLREEAIALAAECGDGEKSLSGRIGWLARMLAQFLLRLVERADILAQKAVRGEDIWGEKELPILRARPADRLVLAGCLLGLACLAGGLW